MSRISVNREPQHGSLWQWMVTGWHTLRDKASSALTYFAPTKGEQECAQQEAAQRWGVAAVDVADHRDRLEIDIELPGMNKADLSIDVHGRRLVVTGEKHSSSSRHEGDLVVTQRAFGRFERVIPLPCDVETGAATAAYDNGVLHLKLPKDRAAQPRRITVQG